MENARLDYVLKLAGLRIKAEVLVLRLAHPSDDQRPLVSGVLRNLTNGFFKGAPYDIHPSCFIIVQFESFQDWDAPQISGSAPSHAPFFDGGACRVHGIVNA